MNARRYSRDAAEQEDLIRSNPESSSTTDHQQHRAKPGVPFRASGATRWSAVSSSVYLSCRRVLWVGSLCVALVPRWYAPRPRQVSPVRDSGAPAVPTLASRLPLVHVVVFPTRRDYMYVRLITCTTTTTTITVRIGPERAHAYLIDIFNEWKWFRTKLNERKKKSFDFWALLERVLIWYLMNRWFDEMIGSRRKEKNRWKRDDYTNTYTHTFIDNAMIGEDWCKN